LPDALPARWVAGKEKTMKTLAEVTQIMERARDDILKFPEVTGIDVGSRIVEGKPTDELVIRIYVANRKELPPPIAQLTEIEGVPVEIIERHFKLH
jgi:hypothetical protein